MEKPKLEFISLFNPIKGDFVGLVLFKETALIPKSYIHVSALEEHFRYGLLNYDLKITPYNEKDRQDKNTEYNLKTLLKECPEIREYARQYFPEYII